jgi:hypothetical protein
LKLLTRIKLWVATFRSAASYPGEQIEKDVCTTLHYLPSQERINLTTLQAVGKLGLNYEFAHLLVAVDALYRKKMIQMKRDNEGIPHVWLSLDVRKRVDDYAREHEPTR